MKKEKYNKEITEKLKQLKCPCCWGKMDERYPNCFHCENGCIDACAMREEDISEMVQRFGERLREFYAQYERCYEGIKK